MDDGALDRELDSRGADAFVHVGDRFDDSLRYLTRFSGPDREYAFVYDGDAFLCAPRLFENQAREEFSGTVVSAAEQEATTAGQRAAELVSGTVLVPRSIPHDAAVWLERAGCDLESTDVVERMRARKTEGEIDRIRTVQEAAQTGMARAETVLASASIEEGSLEWEGEVLTTERLRREVNAAMALEGVRDAGNTVIGAGERCADLHFAGDVPIRRGETVLLDLSPRGPEGYYGDLSRTFVVDPEGGWERRAYVAVERAQDAAFEALSDGAGTLASTVHEETAAEISAYGFRPDGSPGFTHGTGHGVGMSLHEAPSLRSNTELEAGMVLTVEPGVYDPQEGGVRIEDLVLVREEGFENLTEYPRSLVPEVRSSDR
ncbi:Xaa-Pro peptidase family protein [Halalkalicoccus sp. NIPERK01]|uniref:M24 family metallopeptidase n=1 Tax=Halalkalicoccus sp. NIPERK01 TaxID=3053469 RepID=UPI00256F5803|nr:Xaa-Pro peptidase family protein [Halalkalicoccus sp. NIPERK01]MDL5361801.1 Xaa-Pro peptidase family protein [Halalkalicoccus sp. NIPERK01]